MNIAIFASAFYPHVGGVEELCRQLALHLIQKGHRPIILTNRWPRDLPAYEVYQGIPVHRICFRVPDGSMKAKVSYALKHNGAVRDMCRVLHSFTPDLLHVQCVSSNGYYAKIASDETGLPVVVTSHGELTNDANSIYANSRFINTVMHAILDKAIVVTACSGHTLNDLKSYHPQLNAKRTSVVFNGIDTYELSIPGQRNHPQPYMLAVGRLVSQKAFDYLINAYCMANITDCDLVIAGEGPEHDQLKRFIEDKGLSGKIRLYGRAERPEVVALFQGCEFFILSSRHEAFGIVNIEAMAAGKALISTRVGGVPEYIRHGVNGLLVDPEDTKGMSDAIKLLHTDENLRKKIAIQAAKDSLQFDWSHVTEQYLEIYRNVLGK